MTGMDTTSFLYRTFKPGPQGLFTAKSDVKSFGDDQIRSIKITRGSDGPHPKVTPSTAEVRLTGAVSIPRDAPLAIRTTPDFGTALAVGSPATGGEVIERFNGRKALISVDDEEWANGRTPARWSTVVTATSWTTLLRNASRTTGVAVGNRSASAVINALKHPDIVDRQPVTYSSLYGFDTAATAETGRTFDEMMGTWAEELHTLVQHQRSGTVRVISNVWRRASINVTTPVWTLLRAHTLSPARWTAPSEAATTQYRYTVTENGVPVTTTWPLGADVAVVPLKTETIDLSQINRDTDSVSLIMGAINLTTNIARVGVESVTIDLGLLWRMGDPSALLTLRSLLTMEAGDRLFLGMDWPQGVRGPYFANQIEEEITPDAWTITLKLYQARYVVGLPDSEIPVPPAATWDASALTWDQTPGPWG